jgi:hypothetical protein
MRGHGFLLLPTVFLSDNFYTLDSSDMAMADLKPEAPLTHASFSNVTMKARKKMLNMAFAGVVLIPGPIGLH